jgi:hypothetical protein
MLEYYPLLVESAMDFVVFSKKILLENGQKTSSKRKKAKNVDLTRFQFDP